MKKQTEKIGICPYCGWKSKVNFDKNAELVGENTVLIYCDNCQEEYPLDCHIKLGENINNNSKREWQ